MEASTLIVAPLASAKPSLAVFGGKARSLARLAASGLPTPDGFVLSTRAYQEFVEANELREPIFQIVSGASPRQAASMEQASASIRSLFEAAPLSTEAAESIERAYAALGDDDVAVAVRSSATAEDLPESSFAGQQDTYLNVRGTAALLDAIRRCWASLWTARAISYRMNLDIDQRSVAMGVIVQLMAPADVSGVLFTANPSTGDRSELVVNASYGLGEAVVGGTVTPDTYVLDRKTFEAKETVIGAKEREAASDGDEGAPAESGPAERRNDPALSATRLRELASLSLQAEALFEGAPQDIEWAASGDEIWLLQSRPITSLPPPPLLDVAWDPPSKGAKLIRRQAAENMPGPLSPLFDELYLRVGLEEAIDQFIADFGMRIRLGDFVDRPFFLSVNGYAYCRGSYRFSWHLVRSIPSILYAYIRVVPRLMKNLRARWREEALPAYLEVIQRWESVDLDSASDDELLSGVRQLAIADAHYWFNVSIMVAGAKVTDGLLHRFLQSRLVPGDLTSGMFLCGFPSKAMEAQRDLETIARRIQNDASLSELVQGTPVRELLDALRQDPPGRSLMTEIDRYFERYGRQVYNLDFAEPTQVEDPTAVLLSLKMLVSRRGFDTPSRQADLVRERDALIEKTLSSLGPIRRRLFRKFLGWAQSYAPCREDSLFYMGAAWRTLRGLALELGKRLAAAGALAQAEDVFCLESAELAEACAARGEERTIAEMGRRAEERRKLRESRKRLHPPGIIPVGSRWKFGPFDMTAWETQKRNPDDADRLSGFAVSPGQVAGVATVVLSPADFSRMKPDTILVCPTTTPAWTPLLAQSLGLVTDIGGILAHGSIVAREYGIPAVMGAGNATQRIVSGQRILVDGDAGVVTILE